MENKYFKPSIEDIRIGYELEFHNFSMDELGISELNYDRWDSTILNKGHVQTIMKYGVGNGLRVPFLTKEKIEAEQGIILELDKGMRVLFKKDNHWLSYDFNTFILSVIPIDPVKEDNYWEQVRFIGRCKCINQFRTILKLLNI